MQFIEGQETQALRSPDQVLSLIWPSENELEHYVVREQDVGGFSENLRSLIR